MDKQKKKRIKKYISWVLLVALVAVLAALPMIAAKEEPLSGPQASILSAAAENRDISSAVLGGGTVTAQTPVEITIPAAVKVTEYLVENGDLVTQGQAVAAVDRVSVMTAISQVQQTLEELAEELDDIRSETESTKITATAAGTVKTVFAAVGEDVQDVMLRDGALAVLSLDGLMAVQVNRDTSLTGGDRVCLTLSDGTELEGRVESNLEGVLTVTVEDDGFAPGEDVKVTTEDGDRIGSGQLYIHSPWNVVAYSGTVSRISVREGAAVSAGQRLFELDVEGHTARFDSLSRQHREYEALMLELFKMYQSETVTAPAGGMITGVDKEGAYMLSGSEGGWKVTLLANGPGGDENTYVNYVGQVAEVGIDGLIMKMNPQAIAVTDYHDLSGVPMDTALMTETTTYTGTGNVPIYVLTDVTGESGSDSQPAPDAGAPADPAAPGDPAGGTGTPPAAGEENPAGKEWVQLSPYAITAGDILLFAGDNSGVVWVVRVGHVDLPQSSQPGGDQPQGGQPNMGGQTGVGGGMPSIGGGMPSGMPSGGMNQEASDDLYSLDTVTIASVTAQETVTVSITVDELDVLKLFLGQEAEVRIGALPGQQFPAAVTEISATGENEGGNSKFTVTVSLDKIPQMLSGMNASVSIPLDTARQVLSIPVAALIEDGTRTLVYRGYDEESGEFVDPVEVTTGLSDGEYVQILSGIGPGEQVYYPYYDTLVVSDAPEAGGFPFG